MMRIETIRDKRIRVTLVGMLVLCVSGCGSSPESDAWKTREVKEDGTVSGIPRGTVLVGTPKELAGGVRVRMVDTLGKSRECRVVVIDGEGRIHVGDKTAKVLPGGTCRSTSLIFSGIKLTEVRELRFQERPHRQAVAQVGVNPTQVKAAEKSRLIEANQDKR